LVEKKTKQSVAAIPRLKSSGVQSRPEDEKRPHPHECCFLESSGFAVSTALPVVEVSEAPTTGKLISLKSSAHLSSLALFVTL
jgi:hypothetical protein